MPLGTSTPLPTDSCTTLVCASQLIFTIKLHSVSNSSNIYSVVELISFTYYLDFFCTSVFNNNWVTWPCFLGRRLLVTIPFGHKSGQSLGLTDLAQMVLCNSYYKAKRYGFTFLLSHLFFGYHVLISISFYRTISFLYIFQMCLATMVYCSNQSY